MDWHDCVDEVSPHVFRIETPTASGTGFLAYRDKENLGIVTAAHVVRDAIAWGQLIKVRSSALSEPVTLVKGSRVAEIHSEIDSAFLACSLPDIVGDALPKEPIEAVPLGESVVPGVQVAWLGYPYMVNTDRPCFFSGYVSAFASERYFIDGVAIPGVSGGPAFFHDGDPSSIRILGSITAYSPSRSGQEVTPGLMVADNCAHWYEVLKKVKKKKSVS